MAIDVIRIGDRPPGDALSSYMGPQAALGAAAFEERRPNDQGIVASSQHY